MREFWKILWAWLTSFIPHRHVWGKWAPMVVGKDYLDRAIAKQMRTCEGCGRTEIIKLERN